MMTESATGSDQSALATSREPGDTGTALSPALLAELTRALLPYLGPYSITTVKRAARNTDDAHDLLRQIANHIEDLGKRERFLKHGKRIVAENVIAARVVTPATPATSSRPTTPITPELMQRGELALAPIIGPLANVLVLRYANAASSREFFDRLAEHLHTPDERDSFFLSVRTGNGTWRQS